MGGGARGPQTLQLPSKILLKYAASLTNLPKRAADPPLQNLSSACSFPLTKIPTYNHDECIYCCRACSLHIHGVWALSPLVHWGVNLLYLCNCQLWGLKNSFVSHIYTVYIYLYCTAYKSTWYGMYFQYDIYDSANFFPG